jgi:hypothetical protein
MLIENLKTIFERNLKQLITEIESYQNESDI